MMNQRTKSAFTLIELLMVIAIIGVLAGILIPTVGAVRKQANKAASKAQLSNYVNAINMFKGEYNYYPFTGEVEVDGNAEFIPALSGRPTAEAVAAGNRRAIAFHSFSESEFYTADGETIDDTRLADRFSNPSIFLFIDDNGDNIIEPDAGPENTTGVRPPADGTLRTNVTAWVESFDHPAYGNLPGYSLWE